MVINPLVMEYEWLVGGDWSMAFMTFPSDWECRHPNWQTPSFFYLSEGQVYHQLVAISSANRSCMDYQRLIHTYYWPDKWQYCFFSGQHFFGGTVFWDKLHIVSDHLSMPMCFFQPPGPPVFACTMVTEDRPCWCTTLGAPIAAASWTVVIWSSASPRWAGSRDGGWDRFMRESGLWSTGAVLAIWRPRRVMCTLSSVELRSWMISDFETANTHFWHIFPRK